MNRIIYLSFLSLFFFQCESDDSLMPDTMNPVIDDMSQTVIDHLEPLAVSPLDWTDESLIFFDAWKDKQIVGLGEGTHGSTDFFEAKHRIFKYMVEKHGFRIFAIEADFGESIYINEAILASDKTSLRALMTEKMLFWTWKTEEVLALLLWMCDYNEGKAENEKLHYVGVDCKFNTYHPLLVNQYLNDNSPSLADEASEILAFLLSVSANGASEIKLSEYMNKLEDLEEFILLFEGEKENLISKTSTQEYLMTRRLLELCKQAFEQEWSNFHPDVLPYSRDPFMAENALWYLEEFFEYEKMIMWQHNYHVGRISSFGPQGSLGTNLSRQLGEAYRSLGFSFAKGAFTAFYQPGTPLSTLRRNSITSALEPNTINSFFYATQEPAFLVATDDLIKDEAWESAFDEGLNMINIGATYNGTASDYYLEIEAEFWDVFIHFQNINDAIQL